ncbi:hypothetical protein AWJ14_07325 [Hoeflea olei]|uniref:Biopolymer transporter ExbD n=1 Tax=Hoeflea olei TaxID=1480615 RepID=A0A1C1YTV0_9HYPH|nr:hypothetical protein AWJ14_07325 [Hoeflea olei]
MIDVIFLLLLFFMLSSTFSRYAEIGVAGGGGTSTAQGKPDVILSVGRDEVRLNGTSTLPEEIETRLGELKEAGAAHVLVVVEADAASQDFVTAMAEARKSQMTLTVARRKK